METDLIKSPRGTMSMLLREEEGKKPLKILKLGWIWCWEFYSLPIRCSLENGE